MLPFGSEAARALRPAKDAMMEPTTVPVGPPAGQTEFLRSLLQISVDLSATRDRRALLEKVVTEARRLSSRSDGTMVAVGFNPRCPNRPILPCVA